MTEPQIFETKDLPRAHQPAPVPHLDALAAPGQPAGATAKEPAKDSGEETKAGGSTRAKRGSTSTSDQS